MKHQVTRSVISGLLCFSLLVSPLAIGSSSTQAAKKAKLSKKAISITKGSTKKISIKNKKAKTKYTFTSNKKSIATVTKKGVVKGKKVGTAKITVKEKYKKKTRKLGVVKVTIKKLPWYSTPNGFDSAKKGINYGTKKEIRYYSKTTKSYREANIILPANYSKSKKYPILYLLHGLGGYNSDWFQGNPEIIINNLKAKGLAKDTIIVLPDIRARNDEEGVKYDVMTEYNFQAYDNFINDLRDDLMPFLFKNYSIATGRKNTAIAGFSMGGREALYIGFSMPETFGYIGAFCPAPGVVAANMNGVDEAGLFAKDKFKLSDEYNGKTVVMIAAGSFDSVVGSVPANYHSVLTANKTVHTYYKMYGGHDFNVCKNGLYNLAKRMFK